ncbi:MAG: hypothetical protein GEV11_09830 [Streptosporangiales bacterium]|nr:hypothetical protein [Streptosporangiales bacterium]
MSRGAWLRRHWRIVSLISVWVAVLLVLVGWGLGDHARGTAGARGCPAISAAAAAAPTQPATLEPRSEPRTAVPFQQDRAVRRRQVEYDVTDPDRVLAEGARLEVFVGQFLREDSARELRAENIAAAARVRGGQVLLDVCFDRTDPGFGEPGTYLGTVSIVDPRVARTDITFNVTMAYPYWQFVLAVLVVMLLPATMYVWFLRGSFISHHDMSLSDMQSWLFSRTTLMSLGAGFAASFGLFSATYVRSGDWGADYTAATALFGGTFSAFVAAATAVTAAGADRTSADAAWRNTGGGNVTAQTDGDGTGTSRD